VTVDYAVVFVFADLPPDFKKIFILVLFLVPHQHLLQKGMLIVYRFISLSYKNADFRLGKKRVEFFYKTRGKDRIADKSGLNNKYVVIVDQTLKLVICAQKNNGDEKNN
jgi:hypothetical protein